MPSMEHSGFSENQRMVSKRSRETDFVTVSRRLTSSHQFHSNEENATNGREGLFDG